MEKLNNQGYKNLLTEVKDIILKGKNKIYKTVDNLLVETRWQIGERIVREELKYQERADYEQYLINNLAVDLKIRKRFLYEIIKFYKIYPIVRTVSAQLSWSHYLEIIELESEKERQFYEQKIINHSWSIRELREQIKNKLYQNTDKKEILYISRSFAPKVIDIAKIFKPEYNLSFLGLEEKHLEKELENKIVADISNFLKELGSDFMFLEHQMPILIAGEKHFIDLVLFHRGIPCVVLVDLKIGKFDSRDIGQMNKYVNYFRHNRQYDHEQDAIGLIICRSVDSEEIFYALSGLEEKIFVSKYLNKLPSEGKLKNIIKKW